MRLPLCLLCAATLWPAADPLPDMRWLFERALRLDTRSDVHRFDRVRAWALVPLLYPDDEPRTENDDVWRLIARHALSRLDASAAGYPPPRAPLAPSAGATDPLRERLGIALAVAPAGGLLVREVAWPGTGLQPGDRILAIAGSGVDTPQEAAMRVATGGRVVFDLDGGRRIEVLTGPDRPAPQLAALEVRGEVAAWQDARCLALPPIDGAWLVEGRHDPALAMAIDGRAQRPPPGAAGWSAIVGSGQCSTTRRGPTGGSFTLRAVPLHGAWRSFAFDTLQPRHRILLGVRAGQPLVIESAGAPHALTVLGPGGDTWPSDGHSDAPRVVRHGPAGAMAETAIECNGMVEISVRPSGFPATVRLRILSDLPSGATGP